MKNRKGFGKIDIDGKKFLFNWANNPDGPLLVMYDEDNNKIEIPYSVWTKYPNSAEFMLGSNNNTWHGKNKRGPEWGGWGKRETREMYRKYLKFISI